MTDIENAPKELPADAQADGEAAGSGHVEELGTATQIRSRGAKKDDNQSSRSSDGKKVSPHFESPPPYTSETNSRAHSPHDPHHEAYKAQQAKASHHTTFELDGRPLPDINHEYYDEYHEPEPEHTHSHHLRDSYKSVENFRAFIIHNHHLHLFIVWLIVIDIIIVLGELVLDLEIVRHNKCHHDHDCPEIKTYMENVTFSYSNCTFNATETACKYKDGLRKCVDGTMVKADVDPTNVLHYLSIAVLACFVIETAVRLFALGREFFRRKLEVMDGIVVTVAFVLDLTIGHDAAVALLLLVRLWRIGRIVNGIAIAMESREAHLREILRKKVRNSKLELARKRETVHLLRVELIEWKKAVNTLYETEEEAEAAAAAVPDAVASGANGSSKKSSVPDDFEPPHLV